MVDRLQVLVQNNSSSILRHFKTLNERILEFGESYKVGIYFS